MDAATNRMCDDRSDRDRNGDGSSGPPNSVLAKEDWIQLYTRRILRAWFHQEAPLGLALTYANWIRQDLSRCYHDPLTRAFIEETYRVKMD
ncbi:MAG: hypothetical protein JSW27_17110 [Phycisphaerales bacterium]|nr:MAG: hypothetical protein JSW27_17110 [Phycisphaerales bacterium]